MTKVNNPAYARFWTRFLLEKNYTDDIKLHTDVIKLHTDVIKLHTNDIKLQMISNYIFQCNNLYEIKIKINKLCIK